MTETKELPLSPDQITSLTQEFETPFHLYVEAGIRQSAQALKRVFNWVEGANGEGYINYYAVKANPNPAILEILRDEGMGADTSSAPELKLAKVVGLLGSMVMYTANHPPLSEYQRACEIGARINLDGFEQIYRLAKVLNGGLPDTISFRYNPGDKKQAGINEIIGDPQDSKFGVPDWAIKDAYREALDFGVKHLGLHVMVASNELDAEHHVTTARLAFEKVAQLSDSLGVPFDYVNLGGGLGIPYRPNDQPVDYARLQEGIHQAYQEFILDRGLPPLQVVTENGRHVTGPHGWLITRAVDVKELFDHRDVGVDATTSADLPRTANYPSAYHHISLADRASYDPPARQRVVGSLCEDNDYFTGVKVKQRLIDAIYSGDVLAIHDTGAHCRAMGSNYNGKLRCGELLLRMDGSVEMIRRRETEEDYFATLDYPGLK